MKALKQFAALLVLALLVPVAYGQSEPTVEGVVTDAQSGSNLPGANVRVQGTTMGTATGADGTYSLRVPSLQDTLVFSFVGYEDQVVPIDGRTQIDVALEPQALVGEEVVVVAYGAQRKVNLTGAVSVVDVEELQKSPSHSLAGALQGHVAGVRIRSSGAPGETPTINIRGISTFGNNTPLYIVDGVPFPNIIDLNPNAIASIQVLKDAAASAIYGTRAANGVVIITTKEGRPGGLRVQYDGSVGVANIYQRIEMMERKEYQALMREVYADTDVPAPANDPSSPLYIDDINTHWQDATLEPGVLTEHFLSLSGGNETSTYSVSGGYLSHEGHMVGAAPYYRRYSVRVNSEHQFGDLTLSEAIYFSKSHRKNQESRHEVSLVNNMIKAIPTMPIHEADNLGGFGGTDANVERAISLNPIGTNKLLESTDDVGRFKATLWGQYEILEGLNYQLTFNYDRRNTRDYFFVPSYEMGFFYTDYVASLDETRDELTNTLIENTLAYAGAFGKHALDVLVGYSQEHGEYSEVHGHAEGYTRPFFKVLNAGSSGKIVTGFRTENTLRSFFGRVAYNYDDRYLVSATVRRDGSSRFGDNNRWAVFPSVSAAWRISNESFFDVAFVDELKIRASYGELGSQDIGNYATDAFINTYANYTFGGQLNPGAIQVSLASPNIRWETSVSRNVGLDARLFGSQVLFTANYYNDVTNDILLAVPIPDAVGTLTNPVVNAASIKNTGFEFALTYRNSAGDLSYDLSANVTTISNEVLSLGEFGQPIFGAASRTAPGSEVGELYGYVTDGIFQSEEEVAAHAFQTEQTAPGDYRFKDLNGDGIITTADRTYIGSVVPDFFYGFNASMSYKQWDLAVFLQGTYGNKIFNNQRRILETLYMSDYSNAAVTVRDRWTPENRDASLPRAVYLDPNQNGRVSDRWVEDGSYLRVQNVTLGYSVPAELVNTVGASSLRVYVSAQNLFTLTGYSGLDPDLGDDGDEVDNDGLFSRGFDGGAWPHPRTVRLGVQLRF